MATAPRTSDVAGSAASRMAEPAARRADTSMDCGSAELIVDGTNDLTTRIMADIFARTVAGNMGDFECCGSTDGSSQFGRRLLLRLSRHHSLAG